MAFLRHAPEVPRLRDGTLGQVEPVQHMHFSLSLRRALGMRTSYGVGECPGCPAAHADSGHALTCARTGHQCTAHDAVNRALLSVICDEAGVNGGQRESTTCFNGPRA